MAAGEKLLAEVLQAHDAAVRAARCRCCSTPTAPTPPPPPPSGPPPGTWTCRDAQGPGPGRHRAGRPAGRSAAGAAGRGGARRLAAAANARRPSARRSAPRCRRQELEPVAVDERGRLAARPWPAARSSSPPGPPASCCCRSAAGRPCPTLKVAIDLNAVPPLGIEGVEVMRQGQGARRRDLLRRDRRRRHEDEGPHAPPSPGCSRATIRCWTPKRSTPWPSRYDSASDIIRRAGSVSDRRKKERFRLPPVAYAPGSPCAWLIGKEETAGPASILGAAGRGFGLFPSLQAKSRGVGHDFIAAS